jgi:alpha-glucosidase (family GH31 glycosyl hydrolase)
LAEDGLGAVSCSVQFDIPDEVIARGGERGAVLRSLYPALVRRALFEAAAGHKVPPEGVVFSSDLFSGAQRLLWQHAPRVSNDWAGLQHTLRTALSVGASGVPVQLHSIGNSRADLENMTPELYLRWLGMAVLSGNFCFQGVEGLTPTSFDLQTRTHIQTWLQLRYRLIPYVLGAIEDAARTGLPVQRSMAMSFPADPEAHRWDTQYLLGPALLVAPAMKPGREIQVYLPQGDAWWDLNTGWRYEGGAIWTIDCDLDTLPVFGREGHMLCLGPTAQHTGEFNSARILDEVWMFGMPIHNPVVMRNKIRVMQMQGSSYIKGLEGLKILPSEGLEVKRRGAEVRISRAR